MGLILVLIIIAALISWIARPSKKNYRGRNSSTSGKSSLFESIGDIFD